MSEVTSLGFERLHFNRKRLTRLGRWLFRPPPLLDELTILTKGFYVKNRKTNKAQTGYKNPLGTIMEAPSGNSSFS